MAAIPACVEIGTAPFGSFLIFDAGTGIRGLGQLLTEQAAGEPIHAHIFLTHFHWDHIQGLPFFAPLYGTSNSVTFHLRAERVRRCRRRSKVVMALGQLPPSVDFRSASGTSKLP